MLNRNLECKSSPVNEFPVQLLQCLESFQHDFVLPPGEDRPPRGLQHHCGPQPCERLLLPGCLGAQNHRQARQIPLAFHQLRASAHDFGDAGVLPHYEREDTPAVLGLHRVHHTFYGAVAGQYD